MIELIDISPGGVMAAVETVEDTTGIFDDYRMQYRPVPGRPREMYAPWGVDNELPFKIRDLVGSDEVTAQNKFFNVLACYGAGPVLNGADGQPTTLPDAIRFRRRTGLGTFFLEQITDMKYYFMAVSVIILSKDGTQINRLVHKDACFCRLEKAADMPDWGNYNGSYPVIPTSVGLEAGDGVCLVEYNLPDASGGTYHTFNVPVFFGLVGAGFGNLWQLVRGLIVDSRGEQLLVYVSPSMYAAYNPDTVADKIMVAECPRVTGYITRKSYRGLCCMPTAIGGSHTLRYSDQFYTIPEASKGLRVRAAVGSAKFGTIAGASCTLAYNSAAGALETYSAPLCYFTEDPEIPVSQSIANNS